MKSNDLLDTINNISDKAVEEFSDLKPKKRRFGYKWLTGAACLCLCAIVIIGMMLIPHSHPPVISPNSSTEASENGSSDEVSAPYELLDVSLLERGCKNSLEITGISDKATGSDVSIGHSAAPLPREFNVGGIVLTARITDVRQSDYKYLTEYGKTGGTRCRVYSLEVVDPLTSGMSIGDRFNMLYYSDGWYSNCQLKDYDLLLLSLEQCTDNVYLKNLSTGNLERIENVFVPSAYGGNETAGIIPFKNGLIDKDYFMGGNILHIIRSDETREYDIDFALEWLKEEQEKFIQYRRTINSVNSLSYENDEIKKAFEYVENIENGIFVCYSRYNPIYAGFVGDNANLVFRRYINGTPTSECIYIDIIHSKFENTENVRYSDYRLTDEDFISLPDIATFIEELDLSILSPEHTETDGKEFRYNSVMGWYEKTKDGVVSVVKVTWKYTKSVNYIPFVYTDETFFILTSGSAKQVAREELISLIGENRNIYKGEYGKGDEVPLE